MGNQSPDYYKVTEPLDARWQEVVLTPSQADSLNFVLIQNIETGEQAQQYILNLPTDTLQDQLSKYNLRNTQNLNLVSVKNVQVIEGGGPCSGIKNRLRVVTQRITNSLATRSKLTLQESKTVLRKCLVGFKTLFEFEGYFPIHSKLIFFNQYGDVKVWMNEDLPLNQPEYDYLPFGHNAEEAQMIQELISTIQFQMINPRQFSTIKQKLMTNVPITFDRTISLLNDNSMITLQSRLISSSSRARSPQTESMIRSLQNQGMKVVSTKQSTRYVIEEPSKVYYRQIQSPKPSLINTSQQKVCFKAQQRPSYTESIGISPLQSKRQLVSFESPRKSLITFQSPFLSQNINPKITSNRQTRYDSPSRILLYPQKSDSVIDITFREAQIRSPSPNRVVTQVQNPRSSILIRSTSQPNYVKNPMNQVNFISPYFQPKQIQPPRLLQQQIKQFINQKQPSYIVHQPIIRISPKKDIQISKVSRVSINSQSSNRSQNRVITPKMIFSKIQPSPAKQQLKESNQYSQEVSGYAKASVQQSGSIKLRKQPSINQNILQHQIQQAVIIPIFQKHEQNLIKPSQSIKISNTKSSKGKAVQWIKVSKNSNGNLQLSKKLSEQSKRNFSKMGTSTQNSPVTPRDVMISFDSRSIHDNRFSMADLIHQSPSNQYGIQVNLSQKDNSNNNSHIETSKDSIHQKKKMVIYTDVATIHCDDAIIQGSNGQYKLSGDQY